MIIGICGRSYPSQRMIIDKVGRAEYIDIKQKNIILVYILLAIGKVFKKFRLNPVYAKYIHFYLDAYKNRRVALLHLFNRVCVNDYYNWITTFEKTMPEYFYEESQQNLKKLKNQARFLLKDNCKYILAISQWALDYNIWLLDQLFSKSEVDLIRPKMIVLYPPQRVLTTEEDIVKKFEKVDEKELIFIYVGSQVKRKGGLSVLRAFKHIAKDYRFKLIFIGDLTNGYNNYYLSKEELEECEQIIEQSTWIEYHSSLPNQKVLELMHDAHIGLLPTIGDTFGFSVLEMQASGCPVVTTNREAMPEINNSETGWIIDTNSINVTHKDDYGNYSSEEIHKFMQRIDEQLVKTLVNIFNNRTEIVEKAIASLHKIQNDNSPILYEEKLKQIYEKSI